MTTLNDLPTEIVFQILIPLPFQDILSFGKTCHRYHQICKDLFLWYEKIRIEFKLSSELSVILRDRAEGPLELYLKFHAELEIFKGAERFQDPRLCVLGAIHQECYHLISHFIQKYIEQKQNLGEILVDGSSLNLEKIFLIVVKLYIEKKIDMVAIDLLLQHGAHSASGVVITRRAGLKELADKIDLQSRRPGECRYIYTRGVEKADYCGGDCYEETGYCKFHHRMKTRSRRSDPNPPPPSNLIEVVLIPGMPDHYQEVKHNFVLHHMENEVIAVSGVLTPDNQVRPLTERERQIALDYRLVIT